METDDELRERIRREGKLAARPRLATNRLEEAQQERIWAVVEAHQEPDLPDRMFFEAVLYWARVGCPWRDLPGGTCSQELRIISHRYSLCLPRH